MGSATVYDVDWSPLLKEFPGIEIEFPPIVDGKPKWHAAKVHPFPFVEILLWSPWERDGITHPASVRVCIEDNHVAGDYTALIVSEDFPLGTPVRPYVEERLEKFHRSRQLLEEITSLGVSVSDNGTPYSW